jgi:hypothetical protein
MQYIARKCWIWIERHLTIFKVVHFLRQRLIHSERRGQDLTKLALWVKFHISISRVDFTYDLQAVFTHEDPKSAKKTLMTSLSSYAFWILTSKSFD